ncbi:zeta toxin family protein [Conchiformibius steedae]|uniref:zeta toxin family protein n=1 Tax=Conchiformibius steedae TaxID=153493 RepID=UPI0026ECDE49|nr:zeta toxin family protein [Conchiformibius steedae]
MSDYNLHEDVNKKFPFIWKSLIRKSQARFQNQPAAILLGGQPGAGKSFATQKICGLLNDDVMVINGDEFRNFREGYEEICRIYGKDSAKYTADFAGAMVQKVRDEAIKNRFNIIIEGTFRTAETPISEAANFRQNGYTVDVVICTCSKQISSQSILERAKKDEEMGLFARYTPQEHHDLVVQTLPQNADKVFQSGLIRHFAVYSRTEKIFSSRTDIGKLPSQAIIMELEKPLPDNQLNFQSFGFDR